MAERSRYPRVSAFKTAADLRTHLQGLDVQLPVDDSILSAPDSPLAGSLAVGDGLVAGNRFCIHPMEGCDGTLEGSPDDYVYRRWQRFAEGGARFWHIPKALMAVRYHDKLREVGIHAPANWNRLLEESKNLTLRARRFAGQMSK